MLRARKTKLNLILAFVIICGTIFPVKGHSMGDHPLSALPGYFENAFRVQFDSLEYLSIRGLDPAAYDPPGEGDRQISLHPTYHYSERPKDLACHDIQLLTYDAWLEGHERTRAASKRRVNNSPTREEWWPSFVRWNSPVHVEISIRRSLFSRNLRSAHLSIAVLGEDFDISSVVDPNTAGLTTKTQHLVFSLGSYYEYLFASQLSDKRITLLRTKRCSGGFSIFDLEVR